MDTFQLYKDIQARTNGEIYIGVVGPVRTGKSTFIKRFMDVLVLPHMEDEHAKERTVDELPQSASGRTIMTTEPKFVPKEAARISLAKDTPVKVRLIDCVGYMVEGASGHVEGSGERMVKTPWSEQELPFTKAAEIGTRKVIRDHSTIGIVVTTDGSIGEIERERYRKAEEQTIRELQAIGKPFVVLVNSRKPYSDTARQTAQELEEKYQVRALPVNCEQLKEEDISGILREIMFEFPITQLEFYIPKWVEMLPFDHAVKKEILLYVRQIMEQMSEVRDAASGLPNPESVYIEEAEVNKIEMDTGCVRMNIGVPEKYYYNTLSELTGMQIDGQYELISAMKELADLKEEYEGVRDAFSSVRMRGYGIVSPKRDEITLDAPEIIKQGSKFGVKIHSQAPSIHLIRANIETEIAPIVGNEQQAQDLIDYINKMSNTEEGIWGTNIFGKSVEELVLDGMRSKIMQITDESQEKLQDTMQKIVNDSNGGMVCIII